MKYFELQFTISPNDEAAGDVLAALLADAGCDTFVPTDEGLKAYVLQSAYDEAVIQEATDSLASLLPGHTATFTCSEAPDENWNATWEEEHHFEPITLPNGQQFQILPRQAFGSGEHATTRMMLSMLAEQPLAGKTVIDAGCGTGVLSIAALKLGA
ncbi:MAG: 50S ribosomal protein L11 methyltransferase, partial [Bacteroidaceae bacterium]|nr:50S ribosomal protein L11 methyltransferase [Bacteroidaceae bacterium]